MHESKSQFSIVVQLTLHRLSSRIRIKRIVEISVMSVLDLVRELFNHRRVVLDHLCKRRHRPKTDLNHVGISLAWIMVKVVQAVVLDFRLQAEFDLILAHSFETRMVVVKVPVSPGFPLAQEQ